MGPPDDAPPRAARAANHVGLCVTDLARSTAFYQALGFTRWWDLEVPDEGAAPLLQLTPPLGAHAVYLVLDGLVLELLHYGAGDHPAFRHRTMDEPGLTHLSVAVNDLDAVLEQVAALGGTVLPDTRVGIAVMVRDPDGQLIELTTMRWRASLPPLP